MATYYVNMTGNDQNDGLTPQTAWATTKQAATAPGGSTILFRRGDTFYGSLRVPSSDDPENPTVIGAYGEGDKPKINLFKKVVDPNAWERVSPSIWRIDLKDPKNFVGNVYSEDMNVGYIYADGEIRGWKKFNMPDLYTTWDFYANYEDGYVYVFSFRNPNDYDREICFAVGVGGVQLGNNCRVSDLDVFGGGCHGMNGAVENVVITGCDIHDFGGSQLKSDHNPTVRFGNGVEFWSNASNILVENCRIWGIYDVAFTMQGFPRKGGGWKNIVFRRNILWGNHQSFEIWTNNRESDDGMTACRFEENICIGAGYCWAYWPRPYRYSGAHLLLYPTLVAHHDITVQNNVFYDTREILYHKSYDEPDGEVPKDYVTKNNRIFMRKDAFLMHNKYFYRATEFEQFQKDLGLEIGSTMTYIDGKPPVDLEKLIEDLKAYLPQ